MNDGRPSRIGVRPCVRPAHATLLLSRNFPYGGPSTEKSPTSAGFSPRRVAVKIRVVSPSRSRGRDGETIGSGERKNPVRISTRRRASSPDITPRRSSPVACCFFTLIFDKRHVARRGPGGRGLSRNPFPPQLSGRIPRFWDGYVATIGRSVLVVRSSTDRHGRPPDFCTSI